MGGGGQYGRRSEGRIRSRNRNRNRSWKESKKRKRVSDQESRGTRAPPLHPLPLGGCSWC